MPISRRTLTLALALTPGIGSKTITRIFTRHDLHGRSADQFLELGSEALQEEYKLKKSVAETWSVNRKQFIKDAMDMEKRLEPFGITLASAADAHYPHQIEQMDSDPPGLLFFYGNRKLLESPTFAVLSSRGADAEMLAQIEYVSEDRILQGQVVVTSHDTVEYQRSAVTALRWGSPRIMVFDTGFFHALGEDLKNEPFRTARLWRYEFDARTDLAVSAIHPDRTFHPSSNRIRDRLIACLCQELDFIDTRPGGNMEQLAKMGVKAGRPVRICSLSASAERLRDLGAKIFEPMSPSRP